MSVQQQIADALSNFWDECSIDSSVGDGGVYGVGDLVEPMDSLTAVEILVSLSSVTGIEIPNCVVKKGGYKSKNEFLQHMGKQIDDYLTSKMH